MKLILSALLLLPLLALIPTVWLRQKHKARGYVILGITAATLLAALALPARVGEEFSLENLTLFGLHFRVTSFGAALSLIAAVMWFAAALTSIEYFAHHLHCKARYDAFFLLTFTGLCGVFLAADLLTLFLFFEFMSFTSYVWVAHNETKSALTASRIYLAVAVFGGMILLMGLFLLDHHFGTLDLRALAEAMGHAEGARPAWLYAAGGCMLVGFGAKAGLFPLHLWLPMAHPAAPAPASALLSGILTKSGVFGALLVGTTFFFGDENWGRLLLILGTVTMLLGAVLAVCSRDIKKTLACSSMSQIGFIIFGAAAQCLLGHHNTIAVWGTVLHMFNHSTIKLVLFTAAGVIYCGTHSLDYDDIRGFGRGKPWLLVPFVIAALSIGGVPLWSGYVSKTLLHEAMVEYIHLAAGDVRLFELCEKLFLLSGGLTAAYMAQLVTVVFFEKPAVPHHPYRPSVGTMLVMALPAALLTLGGLLPHDTMELAARFVETSLHADSAHMHAIHYFAGVNLKGAVISLTIGALVYFLVLRRPIGLRLCRAVGAFRSHLGAAVLRLGYGLLDLIALPTQLLGVLGEEAALLLLELGRCAHLLDDFGDRAVALLRHLAIPARFFASLGDWIAAIVMKIIFFRAPHVVVPKQHEPYSEKRQEHVVEKSFSLDLLLSGIGLAVVLVYLLVNM